MLTTGVLKIKFYVKNNFTYVFSWGFVYLLQENLRNFRRSYMFQEILHISGDLTYFRRSYIFLRDLTYLRRSYIFKEILHI